MRLAIGLEMDIRISHPNIGYREIYAVQKVLRSKNLANPARVEEFERKFSQFCNVNFCATVNSGTSALHLGLLALGVSKGDEVIVPAFSFAATANAVLLTGADVVFADIDPTTFNIDPLAIESLITTRTKVIIPVHLYGLSADMDPINKVAKKYGLNVFEDSAQAHGATYKGRKTGSLGDAAAFSFYATKNMTTGEGGAFTSSIQELDQKVRLLRNQGMEKVYFNQVPGFNNRMTGFQAAIGSTQLSKLEAMNSKRRSNARFLSDGIRNIQTPVEPPDSLHVYHQYTLKLEDLSRDKFIEHLAKKGIESRVYYPVPLHKLEYLDSGNSLPNSERLSKQVVSIPVHPKLRKSDLDRIVSAVNEFSVAGS
jgi:dTDP-4-amino-4,6-dideoxygalactose transaminase